MNGTKFGIYGGQYVPEILMTEIKNLENAYKHYKEEENFNKELKNIFKA